MILTTEAIVLHSRRFGDSSRIVVLYTRDYGRISVVAKGIRTQKSNLSAALEPLSHSRVTIYHKKNRDLHSVTAADAVTSHNLLLKSFYHLSVGLTIVEIVLRTQADEDANERIFELLRMSLELLGDARQDQCYGIGLAMRLALTDIMGFAILKGALPDGSDYRLSATAFETIQVTLDCVGKLLNSGNVTGIELPPIVMDSNLKLELESFLQNYYSYHLDRSINMRSSGILLL